MLSGSLERRDALLGSSQNPRCLHLKSIGSIDWSRVMFGPRKSQDSKLGEGSFEARCRADQRFIIPNKLIAVSANSRPMADLGGA